MSGRTFPTRVLSTLPTSGVFVTMRLPRAGTHPARGPDCRAADPFRFRRDRSPRQRTSRTSPHRRALRLAVLSVKKERTSRCSGQRLLRVDLAARARECAVVVRFRDPFLHQDPASPPPRRVPLGPRTFSVLPSTWQRVAFPTRPRPALSPHVVHSCEDPGELGHLPPGLWFPRGRPARWLGLSGARGCGPAATPVLSTDVCSSRILFSKTIAPRLGARRIAFPTRCESLRIHAAAPTSASRSIAPGCCLSEPPIHRRTSDASSPAGFPAGATSSGVGPRSLSRSQVVPEGLGPLHQAA